MKITFEELLQRITPKLKGITHRLNGHFTFFNDDDLYQEAIIHLWIDYKLGKLNDKTDSYILQGCFFHLKNYIRTSADRAKMTSIEAPIDGDSTPLEDRILFEDHSIENNVDESMIGESIKNISLTPRERSIIDLLLQGLTLREVGLRLGISHVMVLKIRKRIEKRCAGLKRMTGEGYQN